MFSEMFKVPFLGKNSNISFFFCFINHTLVLGVHFQSPISWGKTQKLKANRIVVTEIVIYKAWDIYWSMEHDVDTDFMVRLHQVILYQHGLISITKYLSFCLIFDDLELDTNTDLALRTDAYT
jgi:hypothetical protein